MVISLNHIEFFLVGLVRSDYAGDVIIVFSYHSNKIDFYNV